jgi:hypothetical protein
LKDALDRLDQEEIDSFSKQGDGRGDDSVDVNIKGETKTFADMEELAKKLGENDDRDQEIILEVLTVILI